MLLACALMLCTALFSSEAVTTKEALGSEGHIITPRKGSDTLADPQEPNGPEEPDPTEPVLHVRYINGASDGLFRPGTALSRAELAKIIYDLGDYPDGKPVFNDVDAGRYYTTPVNALAAAGVLNGYSDGSFQPAKPVTRAEFVTILMRLSGKHAQAAADFPDVPAGRFFSEAVAVAQENGWVNGYNDGTFRPNNPVTRAEAVTMVNRFLGRKADRAAVDAQPECRFFPDVAKGTWYYYEVMEASIEHTALYQEDGAEQWEDATPYELNLADGLYCLNSRLYLVRDRQFVIADESGTVDGVSYTCTGETGICTAEGETLLTADGKLVLLRDGNPTGQPGSYANGFHVHCGKLYVVQYGFFVHSSGSGVVDQITYHCEGESGVCTAEANLLRTVDGQLYRIVSGSVDTEPGLYEIDGDLYCVSVNGWLLRDGVYNTLLFGPDGKYTSGNKTIDDFVNRLVRNNTNQSMTQREKLYACHVAVYYSVSYLGNNNHVAHGADPSTWCETYMLRLISQGRGNCYCYASEMYFIARRLGYWQARAVSGAVDYPSYDHSWLEINIDGVNTVTDPQLARTRGYSPGAVFLCPYSQTQNTYYRP